MEKPPAIVIKLDSITGLDTARILSRYGVPATGIADDPRHYCVKTNSCREVLFTNTSGEELLNTLLGMAPRFPAKPVLFPCSDDSVRTISANREALGEFYNFVIPDEAVLALYMNKENFYRYAHESGFPVPPTFFPTGRSDLDAILTEAELPYLVKPAVKSEKWLECFRDKVIKINSPGELYEVFEKGSAITDRIIVQQWIKGGDSNLYSCIFYYDRNCERRAVFTSRKLRQWYAENGDACLAEECRNDEVAAMTAELLGKVRFSGLGSVEFKLDESSGRYYIIEPNVGRPVTRIGLVEAAGVPVLYMMYCDASGLPLPTNPGQSYKGVKWISLHRDIQAAWKYYRDGSLTIGEWLKSLSGVTSFAVLSLRDPAPFLTIIYDGLSGLFRPRKNKLNGR